MPPQPKSRAIRAQALLGRMPSVPRNVALAVQEAALLADLSPRGMPTALERFYAYLAETGRSPEQVTTEDFAALANSRTSFRNLMTALVRFAPDVPTAAARSICQKWDTWLNARYNVKPQTPRRSTREALQPQEWPESWRGALPLLNRRVRTPTCKYRPLAPKTKAATVQAIGMCARARQISINAGNDLCENFSAELAEVFLAFMLDRTDSKTGAPVSFRTIADYFDRIANFAARAGLLDEDGEATFADIGAACRAEHAEETPAKHKQARDFTSEHGLDGILNAAVRTTEEANRLPGHSATAARLRRKAVVFAMLVNGSDRQGDLSSFRIGREIKRGQSGLWEPAFHQAKTGRWKENGELWHLTSLMIDAHILAGRPAWCIERRLAELDGRNLLSLEREPFATYHPSKLLREEFCISGHLVRTLITNLLRQKRPDAAWAVQKLLGHSSGWMQETYRTEFAETAAVEKYHAALETLLKA